MQTRLNAANEARSEFRRDINGLRGLSVALVVAFHLQLRGSGGGFIGVDVFFVISGYLMTRIIWGSLGREDFSYWRFVHARAARIWPALAALICVMFLLGAVLLPPFDLRIMAEQAAHAMVFWSNQFFLNRSGYNTQTSDTNWLLHTWSLSVEWQFYLLYPVVLMVTSRLGLRWSVSVLAALFVLSWGCQVAWGTTKPDSAFFLLPARAWELLAGSLAYWAEAHGRPSRAAWRAFASYAGVALVLASALLFGLRHLQPAGLSYLLMLPVAGVAMVLWARHPDNIVLGNLPIQRLGTWSYSIYLWHWPVIVALRMTEAFLDYPRLAAIAVLASSVLFGWASYRFVESARRPLLAMALAGAMTVVVSSTGGLTWRPGGGDGFYKGYADSVMASYFPASCSNFMKTAESSRVCSIPQRAPSGPRRVLVIGDSQAEHLYPWFVAHSQVPVDFFTQAECPPVPNFERVQSGFHCMDFARLAWLKAASPDYDTLVLSSRWASFSVDGAPYCHLPSGSPRCAFVNLPERQALIRTELMSAIEGLLAQGKTVVMLMPTPEARVRVPERLVRESFWYGEPRLVIDQLSVAEQGRWLEPLFTAMKGRLGFYAVSLNDRLCDGSVCKVFDTELGRPVYVDESHFDPVWVANNAGAFAPFVQRP